VLEIRESQAGDPAWFEAAMPSGDGTVYAYHHAAQQRGEVTHLVALLDDEPAGHAVLDWYPEAARLYARLGYLDSRVRTTSRYRLPGTPQWVVEHNAVLVKRLR
jgi:hypothetical protein